MTEIELAYGQSSFKFVYDASQFSVLTNDSASERPLSDIEIGEVFDSPIASPPLEDLIGTDDSVLIVVSDATRATASHQIVNLLVRRLVQNGVSPANLAVIFATGIHRSVTDQEKMELLTPFIVQRLRIIGHDAYDRTRLHWERPKKEFQLKSIVHLESLPILFSSEALGFTTSPASLEGENRYARDWRPLPPSKRHT